MDDLRTMTIFGLPPLTADQHTEIAGERRDFSRVEDAAFATNPHISFFVREHLAGRRSKEEALVGMVLSLSFSNANLREVLQGVGGGLSDP